MSQRFRCRSCQATFLTETPKVGEPIVCPKCGAKHKTVAVPRTQSASSATASASSRTSEASVFVPSGEGKSRGKGKLLAAGGVALLLAAGVGGVVAWPAIKAWMTPAKVVVKRDDVETVATDYLDALAKEDDAKAGALGTVELPPAIRSYRRSSTTRRRTSFCAGRSRRSRRSTPRWRSRSRSTRRSAATRPRTRSARRRKRSTPFTTPKPRPRPTGSPRRSNPARPMNLFDAAEGMAKTMAKLSEGVLSPKKLIPSYEQLVEDAKPPLPPEAKALALDFGTNRTTWDALLKRSFTTLKADGPYRLRRAEVTAKVIDKLGSLGDPPTTLYLTLTRFELEGIDTRWKVTATRRAGEAAPKAKATPAPKEEAPAKRPYQVEGTPPPR